MTPVKRNTLCLYCGGSLKACRAGADWCSATCRVKGNRILRREEAVESPYSSKDMLRALSISLMPPMACRAGKAPRKRNSVKGSGGVKSRRVDT